MTHREPVALRTGDLVAAAGGQLVSGRPETVFAGVSIDSRRVGPGELFVAISGDRFDGHTFVQDALRQGARGVVVSDLSVLNDAPELRFGAMDAVAIRVDDTIRALQQFGRFVRQASETQVIAITGSAGKTMTKELTAAALTESYDVFRTEGNLNNHIGLPLSLLELRRRPEVAVLELGMNHAGEIETLVSLAEPEHRVWTNVGEVHAEFFDSIDAIADAKAEILTGATTTTMLVANADDPRVMSRITDFPGQVATFGLSPDADVRATEVRNLGLDGMAATVRTSRAPAATSTLKTPLLGEVAVSNMLAAVAVAEGFDVSLDKALSRLAAVRPQRGRGEVLRSGARVVVDDSYNSNPMALTRALRTIGQVSRPKGGRLVACLGEMLELGERADVLHRRCGRVVASSGFDALVVVGGPMASALAEGALAAGLSREAIHVYESSGRVAEAVDSLFGAIDIVLVKGSRGTRMDRIVDRLVVEPG